MLFFDKIKSAILDDNQDQEVIMLRQSALESVRSDPGLHQLVPYLVQFVSEKVTHSLHNLFVLQQMMELTHAMIENKSLFVDPYVANLVPPILTCIIGRNLGGDGSVNLADQYQLRDLAVSLIGHITKKFSASSAELQARLARTFLKNFLDPSKSLDVHYGSISGLTTIGGPTAIASLVLPNLKAYEYVIVKAQSEAGPNDDRVQMLIAAILKAIMTLADAPSETTNGTNGNAAEGQLIEEYLGTVIGSRVAAVGSHKLNEAVLKSRESS